MNNSSKTIIIGIGHEYRCDDRVGLVVIRNLQKYNIPDVTITEASGEGTQLMQLWENYNRVILIDAAYSGKTVGEIYRFNYDDLYKFKKWFACSSHTFSLPQALELAKQLDQLPPDLTIFGIESNNFNNGTTLSEPVEAAAEIVTHLILNEFTPKKRAVV